MKKAFSLIELIFVMVIIGILAATGVYYFKPNILQRDVDYVLGKIKEARFKGIGYNKFRFDGSYIPDSIGCIELNTSSLNNLDKDYEFKSVVNSYILCFDYLGRPHIDDNSTSLSSLMHDVLEINITYNDKTKTILVLPMSGFATVASCN